MRTLHYKDSTPKTLQGLYRRTCKKTQLRMYHSSRDGPASRLQKDIFNPATLSPDYGPSIMRTLHPKHWGVLHRMRTRRYEDSTPVMGLRGTLSYGDSTCFRGCTEGLKINRSFARIRARVMDPLSSCERTYLTPQP